MKQNRRILLVDDEPYNILALQVLLQQCGYPNLKQLIDVAYNGKEAFDLVQQAYIQKSHSYGLILIDLSMPIMDGYEASEQIREFVNMNGLFQPAIIACTGHNENEYILKAWTHQIDEVLPKPTNLAILKEIINESIQRE